MLLVAVKKEKVDEHVELIREAKAAGSMISYTLFYLTGHLKFSVSNAFLYSNNKLFTSSTR